MCGLSVQTQPSMPIIKTPASFIPLIVPREHPNPTTLLFRGDELLVRASDLSPADEAGCVLVADASRQYHAVGELGSRYFRVRWVARDTAPADGYTFRKLRSLLGVLDEPSIAIAGRAYQIAEWARTHCYCGACGARTESVAGERCAKCVECGMVAYPRISPAMMVLIRNGDAILLARHTASPTGRFSALAGFLEAGESIEEAVHREVFEEVRLQIHNLCYFGSQSWPFPHSLMIAFTADYLSGDITIDPSEIAEARWYGPNDTLPEYAPDVSIAGHLIQSHLKMVWGR